MSAAADPGAAEPATALDALAGSQDPYLIGVRHHSAAVAAAVPALLDAFSPTRLFIELPAEMTRWLPWLGHADAVAPLALAAVAGEALAFYPFADFSPELAAIRWALARGVPCEAFDLPVGAAQAEDATQDGGDREDAGLHDALLSISGAPDHEALWDRLVESPALGAVPEATRRAALLYGWTLRVDVGARTRTRDLARERYMRGRLAVARAEHGEGARFAAVVGAFHGAALLLDPANDPAARLPVAAASEPAERAGGADSVVTSLVPYGFAQLDSRSGYPAGVRDPRWHQRIWGALAVSHQSARAIAADDVAAGVLVEVCREVRALRHVAGTPDAAEALRVARGLAALRDLPAPGRREVLEGIETALGQGELLGRGRVIAQALEAVLVGETRGQLAPGTPRSGLLPHVEALFAELRLPSPDAPTPRRGQRPEPMRLDPLRSELDRRRQVTLLRLGAASITYADPINAAEDHLTQVWRARWTASTEATLMAAGLRGVTLAQAAEGTLRAQLATLDAETGISAGRWVETFTTAAECGLAGVLAEATDAVRERVVAEGGLPELVAALRAVERLAHGHLAGCPPEGSPDPFRAPPPDGLPALSAALLAAAVRAADGLTGSTDADDAHALLALARRFAPTDPPRADDARLRWIIARLAREGAPCLSGAAHAAARALDLLSAPALGASIGSWIDAATEPEARATLSGRLQGLLVGGATPLEGEPAVLRPILQRVAALGDDAFLRRLPALRDGVDGLSPADRDRLLVAALDHLEPDRPEASARATSAELALAPERLAQLAAADRAGLRAIRALVPGWSPPPAEGLAAVPDAIHGDEPQGAPDASPINTRPDDTIRQPDRWRLILGRQGRHLAANARGYARALDELYGHGRGEGSAGAGAGLGAPFPGVREWGDELDTLFGGEVRQEVLGRAAERGRPSALLELEPESVRPSIELLEQVLSLKGGLSESQLGRLRQIVSRVVAALTEALAKQVRPALTGLTLARPTRRPTGRLDLRATIARNLRTARPGADGGPPTLIPEIPVFRTRGQRAMDWRVILVVDTSGSMDANVIHAALMAAILTALPAVTVHFLAFSTEVIDLTDRAADPLALLLEVRVGGGTNIAKALRHARSLVTAPTRTLLVLLSDFEEGGSVGRMLGEIRALVESGVRPLGLAALDHHARPAYHVGIAERAADAGMPVAALSPLELARWVAEQIR